MQSSPIHRPFNQDQTNQANLSLQRIRESLKKINEAQIILTTFAQIKTYTEELKKKREEIIEGRRLGASNEETKETVQLFNQLIFLLNNRSIDSSDSLSPLPSLHFFSSEILDHLLLSHPNYKNASPEEKNFIRSLTPKNLGHLFGDSFILGMVDQWGIPVEGNSPSQVLKFFLAALDYLPSKYPDAFKERKEEISQLKSLFHQSLEIFSLLGRAMMEEEDLSIKAEHMRTFVREIKRKLETMQEGEILLLPWGWSESHRNWTWDAPFSHSKSRRFGLYGL